MCISNFSKCELIALANTIAIAISNDLPEEDLPLLAAFFCAIGDNLAILSS